MTIVPLALTNGSMIFLAFVLILLFGIAYTVYGKRGSGISQHPSDGLDGAPGSAAPSEVSGQGRSAETVADGEGKGDAFSTHGTR